jgi:hypothetical protein
MSFTLLRDTHRMIRISTLLPFGNAKNLQGEDFLPARRQRLVLGLRLQSRVDQLEHAKGVALATQVGRRQTLSPEHFDG